MFTRKETIGVAILIAGSLQGLFTDLLGYACHVIQQSGFHIHVWIIKHVIILVER